MRVGPLPLALLTYITSIVLVSVSITYRADGARRAASFSFVITWCALLGAIVQIAIARGRLPLTNLAEYLLTLQAKFILEYLAIGTIGEVAHSKEAATIIVLLPHLGAYPKTDAGRLPFGQSDGQGVTPPESQRERAQPGLEEQCVGVGCKVIA